MAKTKKFLKHNLVKKGKKDTKKSRQKKTKNNRKYFAGAQYLKGETDLAIIYNSLLYKKALQYNNVKKDENKVKFIEDVKVLKPAKKALFVIDMQKDFLDKFYERKNGDNHPIFGMNDAHPLNAKANQNKTIGNFNVAGGRNMVGDDSDSKTDFIKFIKNSIDSNDYKHIFFSRDYHPVGHNSFLNYFNGSPDLCIGCVDGGNFPAHCVQGFQGTLFDENLEKILLDDNNNNNNEDKTKNKIQIVFKGMHKNADSFTAVNFGTMPIDHIASNSLGNCKGCGNACSGSYFRKAGNFISDITFNDKVNDIGKDFELCNYANMLSDVNVIEVCGLAGDYCVRDTIVALSNMFKDKKIVLLSDFTRYACLPFSTILTLPTHKNFAQGVQVSNSEINQDKEKIYKKLMEINRHKDITYYLLNMDDKGVFRLYTPEEIKNITQDVLFNPNNPTNAHFITPHSYILNDYTKNNIYIHINKNRIKEASAQ
jgi:nicotinamidase-related amidase